MGVVFAWELSLHENYFAWFSLQGSQELKAFFYVFAWEQGSWQALSIQKHELAWQSWLEFGVVEDGGEVVRVLHSKLCLVRSMEMGMCLAWDQRA